MTAAFVDQLAQVWASLASVCRELGTADWDLPTDCPGWTVRDQVSHVVGTESMLLGRSSPPPASGDRGHVLNPIGELNEAWVEARRSLPGEALLAELEEVTAARLAELREMTDEQLAAETSSPIGRVPYAVFMDVRVMDCWVHEQDLRRAVGRPGNLAGPAAEAAVSRLISSFGYVVGKRVAPPEGTTVVLSLTGPVVRTASVAVRSGRAVPEDPGSGAPTARIVTDSETFACLAGGRWDADRAMGAGRVVLEGDVEMGGRVVSSLATIP
jgi:uncharacterized protein (TIGR03083 family)